jgi:hypothetical protein
MQQPIKIVGLHSTTKFASVFHAHSKKWGIKIVVLNFYLFNSKSCGQNLWTNPMSAFLGLALPGLLLTGSCYNTWIIFINAWNCNQLNAAYLESAETM